MKAKSVLSNEDQVVQAKGNVVSDMDGEKVMLNIAKGKYYNLGSVGGDIWELIESPTTIGQVVMKLHEQYDVTEELCERHVIQFIEKLLKEDLIVLHSKGV
ncbi:lasso peptide biosynthesis PqqD family chaperone [Halalkalibacter sp. AB-rgal2]